MTPPFMLPSLALLALLSWACGGARPVAITDPESPESVAAAPGRIEGCDKTTTLSAGVAGEIVAMHVAEGEVVKAGQALATIDCGELQAAVEQARWTVAARQASLDRLARGAREEEREEASEQARAARALRDKCEDHWKRMMQLYDRDRVVSEHQVVAASMDLAAAEAALQAALARERNVSADPLPEDLALRRAEVEVAIREIERLTEKLGECTVHAPIAATVLRRHVTLGERVTDNPPTPLLDLADLSCARVRAEVDERDVGRVTLGAAVRVSCDAWGSAEREGRVVEVGRIMGRKTVQSLDPAEKTDRETLEVVVRMEDCATACIPGLRVTVVFVASPPRRP